MNKKEKFLHLLKEYGVKEYWASSNFNPEEIYPTGSLLISANDLGLNFKLQELFIDSSREEDFHMDLDITVAVKGSEIFKVSYEIMKKFDHCKHYIL